MQFQATMRFLGVEEKTSNKGKTYYMAKCMYEPTSAIYELYVSSAKLNLVTALGKAVMFEQYTFMFTFDSFKGEAQVNLQQIALPNSKNVAQPKKDNSIKASM